ncbi:MAG TPA: hypothetical protein DCZ44_01305 [Flavobacteriaceae bacterium]|mgnify:FL=1|nr:hypothetical protein [Flavobacteriaceae bacterium]
MSKFYTLISILSLGVLWMVLSASEQGDGPAVAYTSADIADFYAFRGAQADKTVFVVTLQSPLSIGTVTQEARFDPNVLIEFNIDNDGDFKEDLVIQAIPRDSIMYFFGPSTVNEQQQGRSSEIDVNDLMGSVQISDLEQTYVTQLDSISLFAGPRRDPFFFDQARFSLIQNGTAAPEGFNSGAEAIDAYLQSNVLTVALSLPTELLGVAPTHALNEYGDFNLPNAYNVWVSTKRKY